MNCNRWINTAHVVAEVSKAASRHTCLSSRYPLNRIATVAPRVATISFKKIFKEKGEILLLKLAQDLEGIAKVEQLPRLEGKRMTMFLAPKAKTKN